uniref:Hpa1xooc_G n=1 Tax=Xanthomonas oryzae pv. oryzicola TaxID=129394 RepID=A0MTF8_XANOQ|nr:Hpa1xooc_G [Xanthomonas oryzae pv. oryzicola]
MNSLNTQFGGSASNFQVDQSQNAQSDSSQGSNGSQGISEKQLDQLLCQLIQALLQPNKNAEEGKGQQGGENNQQAGKENGASPLTQMLMNIVGEILQAQNAGGSSGGDFGGSFASSFSNDSASMQ